MTTEIFASMNSGDRLVRDSFKAGEFVEKIDKSFFHNIPCSALVEKIELDESDLEIYGTFNDWMNEAIHA
jgi:hypothetical protein